MKISELYEDVQADIDNDKKAKDFVAALVKYLLEHNTDGFELKRLSTGDIVIFLDPTLFGMSDFQLLIGSDDENFEPTGAYSEFKSGKKYIRVTLPMGKIETVEDFKEVTKQLIYNQRVHKVLAHEYIHFLDSFRNPTMLNPDDPKYNTGPSRANYYNSPVEFNAYYHNIAHKLMTFIHASKNISKDEAENRMKIFGITDNFQDTLKSILTKSYDNRVEMKFFDMLRKRNKRALYKRLYQLWKKAISLGS